MVSFRPRFYPHYDSFSMVDSAADVDVASITSSTASTTADDLSRHNESLNESTSTKTIREQLQRILQQNAPQKLKNIDSLLSGQFLGNEQKLLDLVRAKYNATDMSSVNGTLRNSNTRNDASCGPPSKNSAPSINSPPSQNRGSWPPAKRRRRKTVLANRFLSKLHFDHYSSFCGSTISEYYTEISFCPYDAKAFKRLKKRDVKSRYVGDEAREQLLSMIAQWRAKFDVTRVPEFQTVLDVLTTDASLVISVTAVHYERRCLGRDEVDMDAFVINKRHFLRVKDGKRG